MNNDSAISIPPPPAHPVPPAPVPQTALPPPEPAKYKILKDIGKGAFGSVYKAHNLSTQQDVAIKRIKCAFNSRSKSKAMLRECTLLSFLSHPNILKIHEILAPKSLYRFDDVYLVTDLMDIDLRTLIRSKENYSMHHIKYFAYHILCALKYMHSCQVIHRDLKPSNILINLNCDLKICDFGLARHVSEKDRLTQYMVTRYYRAPELLLECSYHYGIDMWSFGCIMAEFLLHEPLFPGRNSTHQLKCIYDCLGTPKNCDWIDNADSLRYFSKNEYKPPIVWESYFPKDADPGIVDIIRQTLVWDPNERLTPGELIDHPFFDQVREESYETVCCKAFPIEEDFDECDSFEIKRRVYSEMLVYHPEKRTETEEAVCTKNAGRDSLEHREQIMAN